MNIFASAGAVALLASIGVGTALASSGGTSGDDDPSSRPTRPATTVDGTISMTHPCSQGGSRTANGTFDLASGALDVTITLTDCSAKRSKLSGTSTIKGTLKAETTGAWTVDLTEVVDQRFASESHNVAGTRKCTIAQKGSYDPRRNVFTGNITRSACVTEGSLHEELGLAEWVMKRTTRHEDDDD